MLTLREVGSTPWMPAWVVRAWYLWDKPSVRVAAVGTTFLEGDSTTGSASASAAPVAAQRQPEETKGEGGSHRNGGRGERGGGGVVDDNNQRATRGPMAPTPKQPYASNI